MLRDNDEDGTVLPRSRCEFGDVKDLATCFIVRNTALWSRWKCCGLQLLDCIICPMVLASARNSFVID